jgi:hypothetical protein
MAWGRKETDEAGSHSAADADGQAAEALAASVVVLKESIGQLNALTDQDALDLRAHIRAIEQRLSEVEAKVEALHIGPGPAPRDEGVGDKAQPSDDELEAARAHKEKTAMRKRRAALKRRTARAKEAEDTDAGLS